MPPSPISPVIWGPPGPKSKANIFGDLGLRSLELHVNLFCDRNRTFFVKYALKSQALYAASPRKRRSACFCCLTMKSVLLFDSSRNNSSVDDVPSQ